MKTVALIGRTNVGKSTLFNRLCHKKLAIVHDTPGVTRDRKEALATWNDQTFRVIDTAGLENGGLLQKRMWEQTCQAIDQADILLMIVDARTGMLPLDEQLAKTLRGTDKQVFVLANKCEAKDLADNLGDFFKLGLGAPLPLSAAHGLGMADLMQMLMPLLEDGADIPAKKTQRPVRLAVIGRPNVGKSTLINRIVNQNRLLTGPMAGVTRDAIEVPFDWDNMPIVLIDTAGLRKRSHVTDSLEQLSGAQTTQSIDFSTVVVLVVDATVPMERQDVVLAAKVFNEGRALVLALNKWDLVENPKATLRAFAEKLQTGLTQVKGIPTVPVSAKTGFGIATLMKQVQDIYARWNKRIPTHKLNDLLKELTEKYLPPISKTGRRINLKYMTQVSARPPSFVIFSSSALTDLPESYIRYLTTGIQNAFQFAGVPMRVAVRKQDNPYAAPSSGTPKRPAVKGRLKAKGRRV